MLTSFREDALGSTVRANDTLQIAASQGFPVELNIQQHQKSPLHAAQFADRTFPFWGKEEIRNFQQPPVKNFLVENCEGKHIYWGLIAMLIVEHDYMGKVTAGRYQIHMLYTYEQMKMAAQMLGLDPKLDYFL